MPPVAALAGANSSRVASVRTVLIAVLALGVAGCGVFSSPQASPSNPGNSTATSQRTASPAPTFTPSPTPQLVHSLTLVTALDTAQDPVGTLPVSSPAGLAWSGLQDAAANLGVSPRLVEPPTNAELAAAIATASDQPAAVVVTVGPAAASAVVAAAAAHPATQYLELGVAVPDGSPANVHGIVFDQAQAGYLAGYVAASFSTSGKVGLVGVSSTDAATSNYAAGFTAGVRQAGADGAAGTASGGSGAASDAPGVADATASVSFVGTATAPEKGRTTSAGLIKAGNDVLTAMPNLSGVGAMRDACGRKARLVGLESDAWQTVPDVQPCLVASVLNRSDVAIRDAVLSVAHSAALPSLVVEDVASGGLSLSEFHVEQPAGFAARLAGVMAAMSSQRVRK